MLCCVVLGRVGAGRVVLSGCVVLCSVGLGWVVLGWVGVGQGQMAPLPLSRGGSGGEIPYFSTE